ncbi:hypothetical protein NQ318_005666 [Aromia moschata]|uniref:Uncharacterized protein n=1 Tax=Aromia moschata TaxID=1265417 RepID=A0AAV8XYA1_9CUCU|nr:hypothetical protein NQ318_005666 [Aromia moschata]
MDIKITRAGLLKINPTIVDVFKAPYLPLFPDTTRRGQFDLAPSADRNPESLLRKSSRRYRPIRGMSVYICLGDKGSIAAGRRLHQR